MLVNQLLLVFAAYALVCAAVRTSDLIVSPGPPATVATGNLADRLLAAAALGAAFVVCWTLGLGLVGLAGSAVWLAAGPIAAWAVTRALMPQPPIGVLTAAMARWQRASAGQRILVLGLAGLGLGCVAEVAVAPAFGVDAVSYHLPDAIGWLHSGHAGAAQTFSYDIPFGYFPVTNEVLLTWGLGISRSFAPLATSSVAFAGLTLVALWRLLALLRVPRAVAAASLAAFAALPTFLVGLIATGPGTDLAAVAWLVCAAALSAGARPALLAPALVAAGLAVGTKTTVAPLAAAVLLAGAWSARRELRSVRRWLVIGSAGGLVVGAPWYVRAALTHGWPLWPFTSGPGGDPVPHTLKLFHASFLSRPRATVAPIPSLYLKWTAGGLVLIVGTATALLARSRAALLAAALALGAVLSWAAAPFTGISASPPLAPLALTAVRYLLSALGACVVAVAIAGRDAAPGRRRVVFGVLAAAIVASLVADFSLGYPAIPRPFYPLAGGVLGAVAGAVVRRRPEWGKPAHLSLSDRRTLAALQITAALFAAVALALAAPGWLWRELKAGTPTAPAVAFMLARPGFASGSQPIAFAPEVLATLAGPALRHPISLIGAQEPCAHVRARLKRGWVVVSPRQYVSGITQPFDAPRCLSGTRPIFDDGNSLIYTAMEAR